MHTFKKSNSATREQMSLAPAPIFPIPEATSFKAFWLFLLAFFTIFYITGLCVLKIFPLRKKNWLIINNNGLALWHLYPQVPIIIFGWINCCWRYTMVINNIHSWAKVYHDYSSFFVWPWLSLVNNEIHFCICLVSM